TIFTSKEGPGESIDLSGEVNWAASTKKDIPGGMGIKFLHLNKISQQKINNFVDHSVARIRRILLKEMFYSRM
ncbi:MAG: hypothetical protein PHQ52_06655, partial [Candidatus Omnitrophica bacterium]|nr:hypothetical protein [Candidatus Omnitrophota bacterium]